MHSKRDIVQEAWEDISKEMWCESNRYLNTIHCAIAVLIVWNIADFTDNILQ
jgi:hypothetical protein